MRTTRRLRLTSLRNRLYGVSSEFSSIMRYTRHHTDWMTNLYIFLRLLPFHLLFVFYYFCYIVSRIDCIKAGSETLGFIRSRWEPRQRLPVFFSDARQTCTFVWIVVLCAANEFLFRLAIHIFCRNGSCQQCHGGFFGGNMFLRMDVECFVVIFCRIMYKLLWHH